MRRAIVVLGAILSCAAGMAAAADEPNQPRRLEPTTAWRLDYGDERCSLAQQYGSGSQAILFQIDSYGSWHDFRMTLAGSGVPHLFGSTGVIAYRLPGDPAGRQANVFRGSDASGQSGISFPISFIPFDAYEHIRTASDDERAEIAAREKPAPDFERTINAMVVAFGSGENVEFHVGDLAQPLAALRNCIDSLVKSWGLDPAVQRNLSRSPMVDKAKLARPIKHSKSPPSGDLTAVTSLRFMIDAKGKVTSCVAQIGPVNPTFVANACGVERYFLPALDASGKPVPSEYTTWASLRIGP